VSQAVTHCKTNISTFVSFGAPNDGKEFEKGNANISAKT
jgi:hypothetical protein